MPRKVYTEQFKRDAVAMFESNPDTSMRKVAEELGINRSTWDAGTSNSALTSPRMKMQRHP